MLLADLVPEIEDRYKQQEMGMDGADLGEQRKAEIRARAPEIPLKLIEQVQEEHFLVRSSNQEKNYISKLWFAARCRSGTAAVLHSAVVL